MGFVYMVIRYTNELDGEEWGVSDTYTLVGIYTDRMQAEFVKTEEKQKIIQNGYNMDISIETVRINYDYSKDENGEVFLGGGYYIE